MKKRQRKRRKMQEGTRLRRRTRAKRERRGKKAKRKRKSPLRWSLTSKASASASFRFPLKPLATKVLTPGKRERSSLRRLWTCRASDSPTLPPFRSLISQRGRPNRFSAEFERSQFLQTAKRFSIARVKDGLLRERRRHQNRGTAR